MDQTDYKNIVSYKQKSQYPALFTKRDKLLLRRKAALYEIEGGELYYWRHKHSPTTIKTKVVCGADEANAIFMDFHGSPTGAHCGQTRTREAISKRFYWPGMSVDINKWVSQCPACQASTISIKRPTEYTRIKVSQPFELVGMDLIGKLAETRKGHQYICVMIDYLTKWPQAYPLKSKAANEVTACIIKFVHQFESPKRILTDQGKEFVNAINKTVCKILNIKRSLCSPYHPQTNGLVERINGTIQRALSKVVGQHPEMWDDYLDAVMFGLRTKKQTTTKYSPYFLMFGREARYPSQVPEHYVVDDTVEEIMEHEDVSQELKKQQELLELVKENLEKGHEKTRGKVKSTDQKYKFKVGDKVWRQNVRNQQRKGGKLEASFLGPYTVVAVQGKNADLQNSKGVIFPKINIDHLKCYIEDTPRVPHWGDKKKRKAEVVAPPAPAPTSSPATASSSPPPPSSPAPAPPSPPPPSSPAPASSSPPPPSSPAPAPPSPPPPSSPAPAPPSPPPPSSPAPPSPPSPSSPAPAPPSPPSPSSPAPAPPSPPSPSSPAPPQPAATAATAPPPAAKAVAEKYVQDAWAGKAVHVLLCKIGAYKLFYWDIRQLGPDMELESESINAYLAVMVHEHNHQNTAKAAFIDSFAMTSMWTKKTQRLKIKPMEYDVIVGVINEHHHWTLAVIYPERKKTLFLDPLGESKQGIQRCLEATRAFMRNKGCSVSRWTCDTVPHPIQCDGTSCGVFALKFAEQLLKRETIDFPVTTEAINNYRQEIAVTLLLETDDLTDICHFCGEEEHEADFNWIQCDICLRWYHHMCVSSPPTEDSFMCLACTTE